MEARQMDKTTLQVALACLLWIFQVPTGHTLTFGTEDAIRSATFEFFAPGSAPRAKGLVGTAFAIGPNEFVTAAHLFDAAIGSRFGHPILLDSNQAEYPIADILQFSEQQDYVVFSLQRPPRITPLPVQHGESTAREVYFAGWTPARKIIIKAGTFSGMTQDRESRQFDWLRFAGPVWGAVGGGPLLDASGHVIGIVQGVSRDEGSNYAVPISLVPTGTSDKASIHSTEMLRALMPAVSSVEPLKAEIPLPMSFERFAHELQQLRVAYFERAIGPLLEGTRGNFVLTGEGAAELCSLLNGNDCQCKAKPNISGELVLDNPRANERLQKLDAGEDIVQTVAGVALVRTRSGSDPKLQTADLSGNARFHLRLAVKGATRPDLHLNSSTDIAATAEPGQDTTYVDFHDRTWHLRTWTLLDQDVALVSVVRELPDGYVVLTRTVPTALRDAAGMQLKFIANLVYYGCEELPSEGVAQVADTMRR
jgi:serine protease Do